MLYKEDEGKDEGMLIILDVKIFLDLELSCDISTAFLGCLVEIAGAV